MSGQRRPLDFYLRGGNEDGCAGLLLVPGQEERAVGITDSGMIDPRRPWMAVSDYLDLVVAMGAECGARDEITGSSARLPAGQLRFTNDELAGFRRDIFRPSPTT